jgi:minor histocompatibility antigen H13
LFAIIATIVVMMVFEHGQPALLYLVPGVIIAVLVTAFSKGEYSKMMEFNEELYITPETEDDDDKKTK